MMRRLIAIFRRARSDARTPAEPLASGALAQRLAEEKIDAARLRRVAALDRTPFGPRLAGKVWDDVMSRPLRDGLIGAAHRDYCGHGLIHAADGLILADIDDGGAVIGPAIATWTDRAAFVEFFARQSDHSCSGWDMSEPVFATENDWYRDNQRLTRAMIRGGLRWRP